MAGFFYEDFVYILRSLKHRRYYIGYTPDLENRIKFHAAGKHRSTKSRIPFKLVYSEMFESKIATLKREKLIKNFKGGEVVEKFSFPRTALNIC